MSGVFFLASSYTKSALITRFFIKPQRRKGREEREGRARGIQFSLG